MTYCGRSLKMRSHHNIPDGNHGNVRKRKGVAKTTRYSAPSVNQTASTCGTDIPAIHYRPDATPISAYSIQLF
jgi:hypothetical protein